ncbi:MAG: hypothetical protein QOC78_256 [Solirubrobacteraceae bacterium]|jgi:hypothetical protein|nr:hypothetical protein [Solirubrobacteraceae bacterium]
MGSGDADVSEVVPPERGGGAVDRERAEELVLALVAAHADSLLRVARRYSLCADDAHDAYQRGLEILMRHAARLDPERAAGWLHTVVCRHFDTTTMGNCPPEATGLRATARPHAPPGRSHERPRCRTPLRPPTRRPTPGGRSIRRQPWPPPGSEVPSSWTARTKDHPMNAEEAHGFSHALVRRQ